jgi:predicted nucleic acid-binding protein
VTDKVVDASAVAALLFNELTRDAVADRLRGATLHAPSLIGFEVANACLKKMRATPGERPALIEAYALFDHLSIAAEAIDLVAAIALAEQTRLSVYDASYLWLARAFDAELVTLDDKLARADATLRRTT